jgi:hypothetical protein
MARLTQRLVHQPRLDGPEPSPLLTNGQRRRCYAIGGYLSPIDVDEDISAEEMLTALMRER